MFRHCSIYHYFITGFSALFLTSAHASDSTDLTDLSLEELMNVTVTMASKREEKLSEAPSIVSVVTRDQLRTYDWNSINDVLYRQPGFAPSMDYDRRTVSSRGMFEGWNNNHLLLLVDGLPFNDNLYGSAYTSELTPLFMVKSIEIIRGPGSALYGSNATNGVVALKTLSAKDLQDKGHGEVRVGNYDTRSLEALTGAQSPAFDTVLGFKFYETQGNSYDSFDASGRTNAGGGLAKFSTNDRRENSYFLAKLDGKESLNGLSFQYHYQAWQFETGQGWLFTVPDFKESMKEQRHIVTTSYKKSRDSFSEEYSLRFQRHNISWNQRYLPNNSPDYPGGVTEFLDTGAHDVFLRTQWSKTMGDYGTLLGGVEADVFYYNGDREHYGNYESDFSATAGNLMRKQPAWLEWIEGNPVKNIGVFTQYGTDQGPSAKWVGTLGMRFDAQFFEFTEIDKPNRPEKSKSFSQFSPRLGLVRRLEDNLSLKFLAGKAFRAPAPTELFGANTWSLASNIRELKPEEITTFEAGIDWSINRHITWKTNLFHTKFENQIAYSVANANLSTNVYSLTTAGLESELFVAKNNWSGFLNYSLAKRIDEKIQDQTISASKGKTTWAPESTVNLGANYKNNLWSHGLVMHYQGTVARRSSDMQDPTNRALRSQSVDDWFSLDLNTVRKLGKSTELLLSLKNLLNSDNQLIKNNDYPFDYQMIGREVMVAMRMEI